jgi:hypothetical protein
MTTPPKQFQETFVDETLDTLREPVPQVRRGEGSEFVARFSDGPTVMTGL